MTLNNVEINIAKWLGKARYDLARKRGIKDTQVGTQNKLEIDINGLGGELAFCKMFNLYPDLGLEPKEADCVDHLQLTYDIKTTKYENGSLLATLKKERHNVDYYVLMVGELPSYEFIGVVSKEDLISDNNIKDMGYGNVYCLSQQKVKELTAPMWRVVV